MSIFSRFYRSSSKGLAQHQRVGAGFTLVELLVVVAIVLIITSVVLVQHTKFDSTTLLRSLSYSIALSVRQAQVYGTSVRGAGQGVSTQFAAGHGVVFNSSTPTTYTFFADVNGNRAFGAGDTTIATPILTRGFSIARFCAVTTTGTTKCSPTTITSLTVYFRRPNPDAVFYTNVSTDTYTYAYVELQSQGSANVRMIKVTNTGQISVCPLSTNPNPASC